MFNLGYIFMVNDSMELSVVFVPLVLPQPLTLPQRDPVKEEVSLGWKVISLGWKVISLG